MAKIRFVLDYKADGWANGDELGDRMQLAQAHRSIALKLVGYNSSRHCNC